MHCPQGSWRKNWARYLACKPNETRLYRINAINTMVQQKFVNWILHQLYVLQNNQKCFYLQSRLLIYKIIHGVNIPTPTIVYKRSLLFWWQTKSQWKSQIERFKPNPHMAPKQNITLCPDPTRNILAKTIIALLHWFSKGDECWIK